MKIEKVNDNQIRCTVTMADLEDRHLKISELVTNSEKAKKLLHDMVQQAATEFGFDVDGMSLMIETAPAAKDSVVFTITRLVDENAGDGMEDAIPSAPMNKLLGAESITDFFHELRQAVHSDKQPVQEKNNYCIFSFDTLEQVILTAHVFDGLFELTTSLYKDPIAACYLLVVYRGHLDETTFNRACNMLSEYAALEEADATVLAYVHEHGRPIIKEDALGQLATL